MSNTPSNVVFFIGGGADKTKERFGIVYWGPTRLMEYAQSYFDKRKGPFSLSEYHGYLDKKQIVKRIVKLRRRYPNIRINLVGHSRGGSVAKEIATKQLRKRGIATHIVIALDPVKTSIRFPFKVPKKKAVKNINTFITVFSQPKKRAPADYVAWIGGQYGERLKKRSHHFIQTSAGHGQPVPLLKEPLLPKKYSAFDLLLAESRQA